MDFKIIGTVIFLLLSLSLIGMAFNRTVFVPKEKTLYGIVQSAEEGRVDRMFVTPDGDFDLCDYVGWTVGCDREYGVTEYCDLYDGVTYEVRAIPQNPGVCLNITEVLR